MTHTALVKISNDLRNSVISISEFIKLWDTEIEKNKTVVEVKME